MCKRRIVFYFDEPEIHICIEIYVKIHTHNDIQQYTQINKKNLKTRSKC